MKKRNADRAILLTELTSVIAHRMVETREREAKALSRSRGLLDSNQSPPPPDSDEMQSMPLLVCQNCQHRIVIARGGQNNVNNNSFCLLLIYPFLLSNLPSGEGTKVGWESAITLPQFRDYCAIWSSVKHLFLHAWDLVKLLRSRGKYILMSSVTGGYEV